MAAPAAPSNLTAVALTASKIVLNWQDNSTDEVEFELERSLTGVGAWSLVATPAANATTHTDSGLDDNTQYYFRIRAVNGDGDSAYSNVASALTLLVGRPPLTPRMYILQPRIVFVAQVNLGVATYPIDTIPYDNVSAGAYTDVSAGLTVLLGTAPELNDLGEQRVRKVPTDTLLYVGRSSRGTRPGELTATNNAYLTVIDERLPWMKAPYVDSLGNIFKDSDVPVGTYTTNPPPVAVAQASFAATIDGDDSITVLLNGQFSFATADGATIATYAWDIHDGTLLAGTLADDNITVTFPAGYRYVDLTVTDSNDVPHTTHRLIYARDPANDDSIPIEIESHRITDAGQQMTVRPLVEVDRSLYRENAPCLLWEREPSGSADRDHMLLVGYLHDEGQRVEASRVGPLRQATMQILDIAGKLDTVPGLPQSLANDSTRDTELIPSITWSYMVNPTLDKYLHYLLLWHSTALEIADFTWTSTGTLYEFALLTSDGESLWQQIDRRARAFLPDYALTCDRRGRIAIKPDPMLRDPADRTNVVQRAILQSEYSAIDFTLQRWPRSHWLRSAAILAGTTQPIGTVFSIAPGDTPGQGLGESTHNEQLALNQFALNAATGHRYARLNAEIGLLRLVLVQNDDAPGSAVPWREIEPAYKEWVTLNMDADVSPYRGVTFDNVRAMPREINIRYERTRAGLQRTVELTLELETVGEPGVTVVKPEIPVVGELPPPPAPWVPPLPGDPAYYYGDMNAYILWDGAHVFRTWDIQASSPTWELVDTGISGTIYDGRYVHTGPDTVGMWLLTSTAVWWCADIMATTPGWSSMLPIATVQAADATPPSGVVEFKCMAPYASEPGYLIVATGPVDGGTSNAGYDHAYFWHTHDYGANWTQVDMNAFIWVSSGNQGYFRAGRFSMAIYASAGEIWCQRRTIRIGLNGRTAIFKSTDLGDTWTKEFEVTAPTGDSDGTAFLAPFPDINGHSYTTRASGNTGAFPSLYVSTDAWATGTLLTPPAGYEGTTGIWRPNTHTFDDLHVMSWWRKTSDSTYDLLESYDGGVTWSLIYASALTASPSIVSRHNTPNGWPPDVNQWVVVRTTGTFAAPVVQLTLNNFSTLLDREGNLSSLVVSWTNGHGDGFSLPRVGPNA